MAEENKMDGKPEKTIDVRNLLGEHDGGTDINPDRVTITTADFADCLIISYRDISMYFDMSVMKDAFGLVDELVKSFEFVIKVK